MALARGYAATDASKPLQPFTFERREPREDDVVISIKYSGICHSDIHQARNEWGNSKFPMVPGHEIAGIVTAVGSKVSKFKVGDRVGVGCFVDSCTTCASRDLDLEQYMPGLVVTYNGVEADGKTPTQGGYSDHIVVKEGYVLSIPENLPFEATAPLLCAGITLYSPLRNWGAGPGKKIAVVGMGGLGHMGVKLAHAMGADVTVLSQSLSKQEDGLKTGCRPLLCNLRRENLRDAGGNVRPHPVHGFSRDRPGMPILACSRSMERWCSWGFRKSRCRSMPSRSFPRAAALPAR